MDLGDWICPLLTGLAKLCMKGVKKTNLFGDEKIPNGMSPAPVDVYWNERDYAMVQSMRPVFVSQI